MTDAHSVRRLKHLDIIICILLVLGMFFSLFLIFLHFSPSPKICNISESFDCDIVNKGPYANIDGISYLLTMDLGLSLPIINPSKIHWSLDLLTSNSFLGLLTLLLLAALFYAKKKGMDFIFIKNRIIIYWIKGILIFSIIYSFYLFFVQAFILKTYCIFCITLEIIFLLLFILMVKFK